MSADRGATAASTLCGAHEQPAPVEAVGDPTLDHTSSISAAVSDDDRVVQLRHPARPVTDLPEFIAARPSDAIDRRCRGKAS